MKKLTALALSTVAAIAVSVFSAEAKDLKIGLSNGWVGSEWRTQMIDEAKAAAEAWKEKGQNVEVVVQSANVDVPGQIAHVRNFINEGVDAIIINPNSPTAFDPVFAQAKEAGILVISTDAEVSSPDAIYVGIDQKAWGAAGAKWLAETLGGKGNVVAINGVAGHPANEMRVAGYKEVFSQYPDIKIVNEVNANWDQAQGQQQQGSSDADGGVVRHEADGEGRGAHGDQRDQQHGLASHPVAEVAEEDGADHTGQVGGGEGEEGEDGADGAVELWEEDPVEDQCGRRAEQEEVVPFDGGADDAGCGNLAHLCAVESCTCRSASRGCRRHS